MNPNLSNWYRNYCKPTKHEAILETEVAKLGIPYRFQHPFQGGRIIADFYIPDWSLVIEVDGKSHTTPKQKAKDAANEAWYRTQGILCVRVTNAVIDQYGGDGAMAKVREAFLKA